VDAVTEGSYRELVQKANELYDNGDAAFQSQDFEQGSEYFRAAAMTYAAAWEQQSTDPNVGTDFATALFYSGNIDAALEQIEQVIEQSPDFQPAHFNLGNYLAHKARIAEQQGDAETAAADFRKARRAYTRAVAIDPASEVGKEADARLSQLPQ
jgi:tetratricopeptide (TPR) repeat protein